jgi:hypothetical protein
MGRFPPSEAEVTSPPLKEKPAEGGSAKVFFWLWQQRPLRADLQSKRLWVLCCFLGSVDVSTRLPWSLPAPARRADGGRFLCPSLSAAMMVTETPQKLTKPISMASPQSPLLSIFQHTTPPPLPPGSLPPGPVLVFRLGRKFPRHPCCSDHTEEEGGARPLTPEAGTWGLSG